MMSAGQMILKMLDIYLAIINVRNQFIRVVVDLLYRITEPVLRPIRRFLPNLGGIDISPVVALLLIIVIQHLIANYIMY